MYRAAALAAVFLLWLLLGPWVLLLALASLAIPRVRWWLRPERPWRVAGIAAGAIALLAGLVVVIPDAWLPIPPGPALLVTPSYVGRAAVARPVTGVDVPQHPHLARNGASSMHNDAWASDAYTWAGPDRRPARGRHRVVRRRGVRHPRVRLARPDRRPVRRPRGADPAGARPRLDAADRHQGPARPAWPSTARSRGRTSAAAPTSTSTRTTAPSSRPPTAGSWPSRPPTPTATPT